MYSKMCTQVPILLGIVCDIYVKCVMTVRLVGLRLVGLRLVGLRLVGLRPRPLPIEGAD